MIDTNKLLTNRSGGSTTLSKKSVVNIGLIREDVIKIDGILKTRLVLSKVREGIEKQNQERLRRKSREDILEKDDDQEDDDSNRTNPRPKKGGGGLLGFLVGAVLSVVGAIALRFLPQIITIGKFIKKIAKTFFFVVSGTFLALRGFLSLFNEGSEKLKGVNKKNLTQKNVNSTFTNFFGALRNLAFTLIIAGGIALEIKRRNSATEAAILDALQLMGRDAARQRGIPVPTDDDLMRHAAKTLGLDLDDLEEMRKPEKPVRKTSAADFTSTSRETGRRKSGVTGDIIDVEPIKTGTRSGARSKVTVGADMVKFLRKSTARPQKVSRAIIDVLTAETADKELIGMENLEKLKIEDVLDDFDDIDFEDPEFKRLDAEMKSGRKSTVKTKKVKVKPDTFLGKGKKGLGKLLSNLGIGNYLKPIRKFVSETVGMVPFIGDMIAFLLDVFVFGEPPGRAAFMAIGSIALGGLLAALGTAIGGPPGAIIGGIIGGIGGDILGRIVYDLFFKDSPSSLRPSVLTPAKGATRAFKTGGFVGPKPSVQPMVNSVDKSTELRMTASYDKPNAGRVKFVPIPLPIPEKEQQQEPQQIAMNDDTTNTKTFAGLYRR